MPRRQEGKDELLPPEPLPKRKKTRYLLIGLGSSSPHGRALLRISVYGPIKREMRALGVTTRQWTPFEVEIKFETPPRGSRTPQGALKAQNEALKHPSGATLDCYAPARDRENPIPSSFHLTDLLRDEVDGPVASERVEKSPDEWSRWAKSLLVHHGACEVGITALEPYHLYSHVGRGTGTWGEPVELDHAWAIAFTVEMDHGVMASAPEAPVVMESARQYLRSGNLAVSLARMLRGFGFPARAHIDGNYRVIAPLVGLDAGLGEIGRMGLLMTPDLGPRVRLGVVTTDAPLVADRPGDDGSVLDFCSICKKCAENCPPQAIPTGSPDSVDGARKWRLDADLCFRYWNAIGTDCGRCMAVCP